MADTSTSSDTITINQIELENLVDKLVKRYQKQNSFSKHEKPILIDEQQIKNGQYDYQNYERKLNLIERVIRLEEGQKHILDKIETQFRASNQRFEDMNKRLDDMNKNFNQRFEDMNQRFEDMNKRLGDMNKSFNQRFEDMNKSFNQRFLSLQWFITIGFTTLGLLTVLLRLWDK